jgi:hypothetical protein
MAAGSENHIGSDQTFGTDVYSAFTIRIDYDIGIDVNVISQDDAAFIARINLREYSQANMAAEGNVFTSHKMAS